MDDADRPTSTAGVMDVDAAAAGGTAAADLQSALTVSADRVPCLISWFALPMPDSSLARARMPTC